MQANEQKSWFGLGAEATVHVWGKPVLDRERQMLRLTDIALDVESEAAFGLLGAAARAAIPYLEAALAESAAVDLKPFAANARKSIEAAIADFRKSADGVRVDAAVTALRLVGIEFDAKTLRVIAEADGTVRVAVSALPSKRLTSEWRVRSSPIRCSLFASACARAPSAPCRTAASPD